jgi:two-component system, NtrC family, sensor kinase
MRRGAKPAKAKVEAGAAGAPDLEKRLAESLERERATSEILRVISSSPTDVQRVLAAIVRSAVRLCGGTISTLYRYDGHLIHLEVTSHPSGVPQAITQGQFPRPADTSSLIGRAILERAVVNVADMETDPRAHPGIGRLAARERGFRSMLIVPMLRENQAIGCFTVGRAEPGEFSDTDIALLQTFADQAVIAIENVRLFTETKEALEQQTATSEILRVISSSPTNVQPVFEAITKSAARLCDAVDATIFQLDGDMLLLMAHEGPIPSQPIGAFRALTSRTPSARAVLEARAIHVVDLQAEVDEYPEGSALARSADFRTVLSIPLISAATAIGAVAIRRTEARPFTDRQVALLQTFADQAVIAIENVRLFTELQASNRELTTALDQQTATSEVLRTIAQAQTDAQPVFDTIVRSATRLCGGVHGVVLQYDGDLMHLVVQHGFPPESLEQLRQLFPCPPSQDLIGGRAIIERRIVHIPDLASDPAAPSNSVTIARIGDYRSLLAVPMMRGRDPIGCIVVSRGQAAFSDPQIELVKTFAAQAVIAMENVRLFKELQVANRELAAASQHKSEFLANMSHELRTPLNAIIGFSEVLTERMFGELNEKQDEYLKDIYASGTHLLSLINDILDLSKIEAGRMELELTDFHLPQAIDNALILVRERAGRRGIALEHSVDERLGAIRGDERKVKQVLLNLLSNALKFTPERGRVDVRAGMVDGMAEISVTDTGVGIALEDQEAVFEEFRQVGTADKKVEGTGLGLALSRKFVELHGGRIWVTSRVGAGSTFTFTIPLLRRE